MSENFDNVSTLISNGWAISNLSSPTGLTNWFQGNPAIFASQSGAANSYVAANFEAAGNAGNINNWLITPAITLSNGDMLSFFTRSDGAFADRLEVRYSTTNTVNTAAFGNVLLSINPGATAAGYPTAWTQFSASISGLSSSTVGRLAFRYLVTDTSVNGDYIGIDSVNVEAVPEPATAAMLAAALLFVVPACKRRKRRTC